MAAFTLVTPATMADRAVNDLAPMWARSGDPRVRELGEKLGALPRPADLAAVNELLVPFVGPGHNLTTIRCDACGSYPPAAACYHVEDHEDVYFCRTCLLAATALLPFEKRDPP